MLSWLYRKLRSLFSERHPAPAQRQPDSVSPSRRRIDWPVVPVSKGDATRPEGPCWLPCHPRTRAQFKAEMICDSNHRLVLTGHRIAADGGVYPSVVCQAPGCGYHEYVRLLGWDGGDLA
jgi:hypothetical protein